MMADFWLMHRVLPTLNFNFLTLVYSSRPAARTYGTGAKANALQACFKPALCKRTQLRVDADNVSLLVCSERLFRIKLMLQHGEVGFRSIAA